MSCGPHVSGWVPAQPALKKPGQVTGLQKIANMDHRPDIHQDSKQILPGNRFSNKFSVSWTSVAFRSERQLYSGVALQRAPAVQGGD